MGLLLASLIFVRNRTDKPLSADLHFIQTTSRGAVVVVSFPTDLENARRHGLFLMNLSPTTREVLLGAGGLSG